MSEDTTATEVSGTRKRHWGRWVLLALGLGIGAAVGLPPLLSSRAERQIERRIQQYRAAGEPVSAAELATPPIVDEENAVIELRKAAGLFTAYSTSNQNWKK